MCAPTGGDTAPRASREPRGLTAGILDRDARALVDVLGIDNDLGRQAGALVDPLFHRDGFDDVAELDHAGDFREDRDRVRIPFASSSPGFHLRSVFLLELGAVDDRVAFAFALAPLLAFG
jgi:hypothetical protein